MKLKRHLLILLTVLFIGTGAANPLDEIPVVLYSQVYSDQAYLFVSGVNSFTDVTAHVSGVICDDVSFGRLDSGEIPIMTTVLIDNTASTPKELRPYVKDFLLTMIERLPENEQLRLLSMGAELNTIHEFGSDKGTLSAALDEITFQDQTTNIYDSIRVTTSELRLKSTDKPEFHQIIIITDGMEDYDAGIIQQELYFHLSNNKYPIHTIGLPITKKNENDLKELFAVSRISGGNSFILDENTSVDDTIADLRTFTMSPVYVSFSVLESMLDGSVRQVSLDFDANGLSTVLEHDMKMPVTVVTAVSTPEPTPIPTPEPTPVATPEPTPEPILDEPQETGTLWWVIPVALGAVGIIVLIILLSLRKAAKRNEQLFMFETNDQR